jgi:hypothetical protein
MRDRDDQRASRKRKAGGSTSREGVAGESENVVLAPFGLREAGDRSGVSLGEPATAGFGFPCAPEVDDQLAGLVEVLHIQMVDL